MATSRCPVPTRELRGRSRSPALELNRCREGAKDVAEEGDDKLKMVHILEASLPTATRERLHRLVEDGTIRSDTFDAEALRSLLALDVDLQEKVVVYMETERIFLMHSRSKSGFLVAACDKARAGALDAMGMGMTDPWRAHLLAIATPKQMQIDLIPENLWLARHGSEPAKVKVDVSVDQEIGVRSLVLAVGLTQTGATIKQRLAAIGIKIPQHKMKLKEPVVGFLKDARTLAFYNIQSGSSLQLVYKTRGGVARRLDHSEPPTMRS